MVVIIDLADVTLNLNSPTHKLLEMMDCDL